ncbi:MAG TPA: glycosyltransferase [Iamia sp.]|nr:glycosyltransferase [Iamia sp.]
MNGPPRRLRLAHLTTSDISHALLLATELEVDVAAGYETFAISADGPYVDRLPDGVTHVPIRSLTRAWDVRSDGRAARELFGVLRDLRLDVLHTHNPKTGVMGRLLGRAARIPVVVNTCHGLWVRPDDGLGRKGFVLGAEALAGLASDAELYQNDLDRRTLARAVPQARAWTVGNGIDLTRFRRDPEAGARLRAALGIAPDALVVGGVGRRVEEKGIGELAEAARGLDRDVEVIWVGPADAAKADQVTGDLAGLRFVDEQTDMVAVYSALDVFVLPSHREGFSRSAMEAAACGCAMVLSDIRGCREIGTDGEHLLLVPPRDPAALAAAIGRLVDDANLRHRLAEAAAARARRAFDQRAVAAMSIETYRRIALRKGLPWAVAAPRAPGATGG